MALIGHRLLDQHEQVASYCQRLTTGDGTIRRSAADHRPRHRSRLPRRRPSIPSDRGPPPCLSTVPCRRRLVAASVSLRSKSKSSRFTRSSYCCLFAPPVEVGIDRTQARHGDRAPWRTRRPPCTCPGERLALESPRTFSSGTTISLRSACNPDSEPHRSPVCRRVAEFGQIAQLLAAAQYHEPAAVRDHRLEDVVPIGEHLADRCRWP